MGKTKDLSEQLAELRKQAEATDAKAREVREEARAAVRYAKEVQRRLPAAASSRQKTAV